MTNYTLITKYRNKEEGECLIEKIREKGKTCYSFFESPPDPNNPEASAAEQMEVFEATHDFYNSDYFKQIFEKDLEGLKNAETVIMLLPAGNATHIEAGIAYGLGKKLILIGKEEKPDTLYLIFQERYDTVDDFLKTL